MFCTNTDTNLDGKEEEAKKKGWIKTVDWHYALEIVLDQS